ncbi:MAG TPA: CD225/dispanin family protein [bacterium]|nr:CD225/dispanin family protein [bacterium]
MYCTHCGASNKEKAAECVKCGKPLSAAPTAESIPTYLVQAILTAVCCCVPFGIVAIVYAAQVNSKIQAQDLEGARNCSRLAKIWSWVAFGCGLMGGILYLLLSVVGAALDHSH